MGDLLRVGVEGAVGERVLPVHPNNGLKVQLQRGLFLLAHHVGGNLQDGGGTGVCATLFATKNQTHFDRIKKVGHPKTTKIAKKKR